MSLCVSKLSALSIITQQSVDPKIEQEIIESYVEHLGGDDPEILRNKLNSQSFEEILQRIEDGDGWYNDPDVIDEALDRINNLSVIDPACGSGHFLTTAMDEIHRVQMALMRGKSGEEPSDEERYKAKKKLALNSIYGVDIEPVGVEIAKLRVWLKMVEGNGWSDGFDPLPNIDVNISHGNSLVGFPAVGLVETIDIWNDDIDELDGMRQDYKYNLDADEGNKDAIDNLADDIRHEKDSQFIDNLNTNIETSISSPDKLQKILDSFDDTTLFPTIDSIKVERADGEHLTEENKSELDDLGFKVHSKSARINIKSREAEIKKYGDSDTREQVESELKQLLENDYEFVEVVRKPVRDDLDNTLL